MNTVSRDKPEMNITNKEFLSALFNDMKPEERCWVAAFVASPTDKEKARWAGSPALPGEVKELSAQNGYFGVATVRAVGEDGFKRRAGHFVRQVCVVLDDAQSCALEPTWRLQTSARSQQVGFRLEDPIEDVEIAQRLNKALANQGVVELDKGGNNVVRYVRLPVGSNTKSDPAFECELKLWSPARRVKLAELCVALGLNTDYVLRGISIVTEGAEGGSNFTGEGYAYSEDDVRAARDKFGGPLPSKHNRHAMLLSLTLRWALEEGLDYEALMQRTRELIEECFECDKPENKINWSEVQKMVRGAVAKQRSAAAAAEEINSYEVVRGTVAKSEAFLRSRAELRNEKREELPALCAELTTLPYGLGVVQDYIYGRLIYPSRSIAGVTALATLSVLAMPNVKIESFGGLGANEQYVILSPTGTGKDDIRKSLVALVEAACTHAERFNSDGEPRAGNLGFSGGRVSFLRNLPASQQALHQSLQDNKNLVIMADEVGEWFAAAPTNPTRQEALGYMMQVYSSPFGVVAPPQSIIGKYKDVACPRLALFATSTNNRMLEVITSSHLTSGAYNRIVWFVAEERPLKRYEGQRYAIPPEVLECVGRVAALPAGTQVGFSAGAWEYYKQHDSAVIEKLTGDPKHGALAGRLSEQAIRVAAMIALSDARLMIEEADLRTAYAIRENLHARMFFEMDGVGALNMTEQTATSKAVDKLREQFLKRPSMTLNFMKKEIPAFGKHLETNQQENVIRALIAEGVCAPARQVTRPGRYDSLIYEDKAGGGK